ncbi:MAG: hypothetical protein ACPHDL_09920 [Limisphaerales bacterium]|jgi:hypothetical protein|tara:strand:+ start:347 stop:490 length:144 start_codon:yes stop_codon:yes gene_type:complete
MWQQLWTFLFFGALSIFALMSLWVTIGGYRDIKTLLQRLKDDTSEEE